MVWIESNQRPEFNIIESSMVVIAGSVEHLMLDIRQVPGRSVRPLESEVFHRPNSQLF